MTNITIIAVLVDQDDTKPPMMHRIRPMINAQKPILFNMIIIILLFKNARCETEYGLLSIFAAVAHPLSLNFNMEGTLLEGIKF